MDTEGRFGVCCLKAISYIPNENVLAEGPWCLKDWRSVFRKARQVLQPVSASKGSSVVPKKVLYSACKASRHPELSHLLYFSSAEAGARQ